MVANPRRTPLLRMDKADSFSPRNGGVARIGYVTGACAWMEEF
jgi:hypothetical protein